MYVGQPAKITESLFWLGIAQDDDVSSQFLKYGWQLLSRMTRWVEKFPYFPQVFIIHMPRNEGFPWKYI